MNRVASERKLQGLTQIELASKLQVNPSTVVRWEAGGAIPQQNIGKLRRLFRCDTDWLLGLSNDRRTVE